MPSPSDPLLALAQLSAARSDLDRTERRLIAEAREQGMSWAAIASALGLKSRQAAEQRWLRLCGDTSRDPARLRSTRSRQQIIDRQFGEPISELRAAVRNTTVRIDGDRGWVERHPRAVLIRATLEMAGEAEPGALYELVERAVDDLGQLSWAGLPTGLADALRALRRALVAARPAR